MEVSHLHPGCLCLSQRERTYHSRIDTTNLHSHSHPSCISSSGNSNHSCTKTPLPFSSRMIVMEGSFDSYQKHFEGALIIVPASPGLSGRLQTTLSSCGECITSVPLTLDIKSLICVCVSFRPFRSLLLCIS